MTIERVTELIDAMSMMNFEEMDLTDQLTYIEHVTNFITNMEPNINKYTPRWDVGKKITFLAKME